MTGPRARIALVLAAVLAVAAAGRASADSWMDGDCGAGIANPDATSVLVEGPDGFAREYSRSEVVFPGGSLEPGEYTVSWSDGTVDAFLIDACPGPDATPDPDPEPTADPEPEPAAVPDPPADPEPEAVAVPRPSRIAL